ncbi:TonB-dependent receptor [Massilia glaciei]|uniref:TonB-dependent receptor n=1 Tax=Massilia glaciei TaxID=1524097 RepID=A0A2U2I764_9BURK|nr:TonB-dependent receptor [Massilia glaciei]PWF55479.1 TonB-dependent receptor [Massilia glaciei]
MTAASAPIRPIALAAVLALPAVLAHQPCRADDPLLQRVLVEGARAGELGVHDAGSAGTVGHKLLALRPLARPGELLEAVPGVVVSQGGGEGKANQFFLRGVSLDHGTDLRTTLDEMPVNQRSHAHGHGWTDLNFLIPELAARLDYKKGPYSAREGDFASAGSAAISYANRLTGGVASATVGSDGFARALVADSPALGGGALLYALELLRNDGPFKRPDDYRKANAVLRYSRGFANNGFSVSAMAYRAHWNASDMVPQRAVDGGLVDRFGTLDASAGGGARRTSVSANWRRSGDAAASRVSAWLIENRLDLYSNFTYFLNDPVDGDQFNQPDRRVTGGVNASHTWHRHAAGRATEVTLGLKLQNDNIINALHTTRARRRLATTRADHVREASAGLYLEAHTRWSPVLRSVAGLRHDHYRFDVRSDRAANSGKARAQLASPSLNLVLGPWGGTELYFNLGNGFRSNDARATVARVDPASGLPADSVPGLVRTRGAEAGMRRVFTPNLQGALAVYRLDFDSELAYAGDAGTTQAGGPSRRAGIELAARYKIAKWLSADLDLAYTRARARSGARSGLQSGAQSPSHDPGARFIPGAVEGVGQFGLVFERLGAWSGALRLRYAGPRPLTDDNGVRAGGGLTLSGRLARKLGGGLRLELEGINLGNRQGAASAYFYASRMDGEAAAREDVHFHPLAPRALRLTLVKNF